MVGRCQICAARALVRHVQQEHTFLAVVLELLEALALDRRGALDLEERNLVRLQGLRDLRGEVPKLNEEKYTFVLGDLVPAIIKSI